MCKGEILASSSHMSWSYSDYLLFSTELLEITLGATQLLTKTEELCESKAMLVILLQESRQYFATAVQFSFRVSTSY
jgi:hypothetical protein